MLLSADDSPAATEIFRDLGALAIPFEATATIGDIHYLVAGDENQTGGGAAIVGRTGNEEEMEDPHRTAYHEAGLLTG